MARARPKTVGQRWRGRRDAVIYVASKAGAGPNVLADVFDCSRPNVIRIVEKVQASLDALRAAGAKDPMGKLLRSFELPRTPRRKKLTPPRTKDEAQP